MNRSTAAPSHHLLFVSGSTDAESRIISHLERDGVAAQIQRVETESDFTAALVPSLDLVLFDLSVSHFTYLEALHRLKSHGHGIPLILIMEIDDEDFATTALRAGVDHVLTKRQFGRLGLLIQHTLEQKSLRESEAQYRGIFDNATVAIWDEDFSQLKAEVDRLRSNGVYDFRTYISEHPDFLKRAVTLVKILDVNRSMLKLYNVNDKANVLGSLDNFVPPEDFEEELIAFAEGKTYFEREIKWHTTSGKILDFLMTVTYYTDAKGYAKAQVHLTDTTERNAATRALRESEDRYRKLVEQIPPIIYISAPDQRIGVTYISPRIESLGFGQQEWIADPQLWFKQIHPEDQQRILHEIDQDEKDGEPFRSEYRLISRDGKVRWFLDEAMNIVDHKGELLFRQGFMLDITQRKQVEESLTARERYLELLNEMTRAVLLTKDFDSTFHTLAVNLAKLIHADDCYIARWDEERQAVIPVAGTLNLSRANPSYRDARLEELKLARSVLTVGHALAADDVYDSPYVNVEFAKRFNIRSALGIPLIAGDHKLGAAIVAFNTPHHFTSDDIQQAEQAGNQVALALWTFQQSIEIEQKLLESNTLANIERTLSESESTGTGEVLQLIVDSARELMPHAEKSVIHLLEEQEQVLVASAVSGFDERDREFRNVKMHLGQGIAGKVIREGILINVADVRTSPDFLFTDSSSEFRSLLVAPVQSSGQQIGTISLQSATTNAFSTKDTELLKALAVQAAIAIENTRLFEKTQQGLKEVNILYEISRGLAASLDADQLIRDMIGLLQGIFDYYHVQIYLIDSPTGNLIVKHGSGYIGVELVQQGHYIPPGEGIVGYVAETGEAFITNNVDEVVFFKRHPLLSQTRSEIAVPIKVDNEVIGVLDIQQTPDHNRFTTHDLYLLTAIADHLAVVLQKARLFSTLQTALQQEKKVRSELLQSERLALVGRLLASVSHELNNPLQTIQYGLFLLRKEPNLSTQARQDLEILITEGERMALLIESLRSAYRPVRQKDFQSISLNRLVEDVRELIATHMRHNAITFEFIPATDLPPILGLPDQIRQVMLNLFLNAIEVMKPGGSLTVETHCLREQKEVMLLVKDTGPGIDSDILPRIFDAFITNKDTGTGLGLTITHDIIKQHHGRIEAENGPVTGAIFKIWLPIKERS